MTNNLDLDLDITQLYGQLVMLVDDDFDRMLQFIKHIRDFYNMVLVITKDNESKQNFNDLNAIFTSNIALIDDFFSYDDLFGDKSLTKLVVVEEINDQIANSKFYKTMLLKSRMYNTTLLVMDGYYSYGNTQHKSFNQVVNFSIFSNELDDEWSIGSNIYKHLFPIIPTVRIIQKIVKDTGYTYVSIIKNYYRYLGTLDRIKIVKFDPTEGISEEDLFTPENAHKIVIEI